ncbi:M15 family metallopeptidase [Lachnospiraceae bacterium 62-35]
MEIKMEERKRNLRRRKGSSKPVMVLAIVSVFLAAGLLGSVILLCRKQQQINELLYHIARMEKRMEEIEQGQNMEIAVMEDNEDSDNSQTASLEENKEGGGRLTASGEENIHLSSENEESQGDTYKEDEGPSSLIKEGEASSDGTKASAEPESPYLKSLSGIEPGTVIAEEKMDFSNIDQYFMSWEIEEGDNLYERINGKSYRKNDYVPLNSLRYLKMPHYNFQGQIQVGELIVSKDIEQDVFNIFKELFAAKYQIQSMYLVDNYWTGDPDTTDSASIDVNNTSAFCYRQATGGRKLSNHAYGKAIDLNPQQNPYVSYSSGSPKWSHSNANDYIKRDTGLPHVITHEDLAYQVFTKYGFRWGGDWNNPKDYQHFDKN